MWRDFLSYTVMPLGHTLSESGNYIMMFVTRILSALMILAIADAAYQRFQYHKDLRMTKQEVKDEFKQMEGDPHVKAKRKKFGMQLRMKKTAGPCRAGLRCSSHQPDALRRSPQVRSG